MKIFNYFLTKQCGNPKRIQTKRYLVDTPPLIVITKPNTTELKLNNKIKQNKIDLSM